MRYKVKHVVYDSTTEQPVSEAYDDATAAEQEAAWRDHEYELYREDRWETEQDEWYVNDPAHD